MVSKQEGLELISIHIPKTAGTSFEKSLRLAYGDDFLRIDLKNVSTIPDEIPRHIKAIHGHFQYEKLVEKYRLHSNIPKIVWVRDPVDRVISNYHQLQRRFNLVIEKENAMGLRIMKRTLVEYAGQKRAQNRLHHFLGRLPLSSFCFIGIVEHFLEDLNDLSIMFGWNVSEEFRVNVTEDKGDPLDKKTRELIKKWNQKDMELYSKAVELRKIRRQCLLE